MRAADDNLADVDAPVPYLPADYPDDGLERLRAVIHEPTPIYDRVLDESDWRPWPQELDA